VERFAECMTVSDLDCLTCNVFWFEGDDSPFLTDHKPNVKPLNLWTPIGDAAELGIFHDIFGDTNFSVKRSVFEALGSFPIESDDDRHVTGEDWEILAKMVLEGYRVDVIPEVLFYYRVRQDSLYRTRDHYEYMLRPLRVYARQLQKVGLQHLIPFIYQIYYEKETRPAVDQSPAPDWIADHIPWHSLVRGMMRKVRNRLRL
jgi:hypothetical protein